MSLGEVCMILGALFAFATLILKVVEVARSKSHPGGAGTATQPQTDRALPCCNTGGPLSFETCEHVTWRDCYTPL
jgi:hypothetical protein